MFSPSANPSLSFPLTGGKAVETKPEPSSADSRTAQLTRGLAAGDETAFRDFHAQYFDRLYRFLLVVAQGQEQDAQEALQQTFLRVTRYVRVFESEEVFWSWLKTVARSVARDGNRKQQRYAALLQRFAFSSPSPPADQTSDDESRLSALLEESLAQLTPEERLLLEAKYVDGFTVKELCGRVGMTEKGLESRLDRLRKALRSLILEKLSIS